MSETTENSQDLIAEFVDEAVESLYPLADQLEAFRGNPADAGPINAVFRAVHSIKGCAGFMGLTAIKVFSHAMENTMDEVRKQQLTLSQDLQRVMVLGFDLLEEMLRDAQAGEVVTELADKQQSLLKEIEKVAAECKLVSSPEETLIEGIQGAVDAILGSDVVEAASWAAKLQSLIDDYELSEDDADSESEESDAQQAIPQPAEFHDKTLEYEGQNVTSQVSPVIELFLAMDEGRYNDELGEQAAGDMASLAAWADTAKANDLAAALRAAEKDLRLLLGSPFDVDADLLEVVWGHLWPQLCQLDGAQGSQASNGDDGKENVSQGTDTGSNASKNVRLVRVKEERIDEFLEGVSSLFITGELLKHLQTRMSREGLMQDMVEELRQINTAFQTQSTDLQQSVVALRRVEIAGLFSKFPRMARQLSSQLGKQVDVFVEGEDIEVDKSLIEDLDAPLTHMIRNAVDHGLELPEDRESSGKLATGNLWLTAGITRTHVLVKIRDDGKGIDPDIMRELAVKKGMRTEAEVAAMDDGEALQLILAPGFSTAQQLSEVSGRGVGMDVVRSNMAEHNGEIFIESQVGMGSTFTLQIPIREAVLVIDGLMVRQGGDRFVVPFEYILEITDIPADKLTPVQGAGVLRIRGNPYEAAPLGKILSLPSLQDADDAMLHTVLVGCKHGKICLLVDAIEGHRQVVLNSLGDILSDVDNIAGVTQLGGGQLALVLDIEEIVGRLCHATVS